MTLRLARVTLRVWFIDHFNFTPIDFSFNKWSINLYTRWFYVVIHLEVSTGLLEKLEREEKNGKTSQSETGGYADSGTDE